MCFNLSYLTFLTVNSKEPTAAEAHITVFLVQRHTSSIIFAWRAFTRTLWKSDWDIKNAWKISPHFIPYITLIYKYINNPNSNLPSAKGVNIRFEDAQSKLKEPFLPNVIISIISTYRRTKILDKILATSKGRKDSPLATDAPAPADCFKCDKTKCDLCKKMSLLEVYFLTPKLAANYFLDRGFHFI